MNTADILKIIERSNELFSSEIRDNKTQLKEIISNNRFLVLGGAGSIGQEVTKEIFKRSPKKLHVVDLSENNLVELVRDIRSSLGYIDGDFKTFALDIGSLEYDAMISNDGAFDYVLNLSALKHVRSEKDPYTLMRMIDVNILNTIKTIEQSIEKGAKKYFCVSTDKAANPVNMMGASKKIMELFLWKYSSQIDISTARFANVAFSDGSLLHGFNNRLSKQQPIAVPSNVTRYFVSPQESGELCMMSTIFGENGDTFFPKESPEFKLISLDVIARNYLKYRGFEVELCANEEDARRYFETSTESSKWPCVFSKSDTTGEKSFEEFHTESEKLDLDRYNQLGIIKNELKFDKDKLSNFLSIIEGHKNNLNWTKEDIVQLFHQTLENFKHEEIGKFLDSKM